MRYLILDGIPEVSRPLDNPLSTIRLLIADAEPQTHSRHDNQNQNIASTQVSIALTQKEKGDARDGRPHARPISRRILGPERQTADDAADATESHERRTGERSGPLAADIVGLVGHDGGDVGVGACRGEEDAKVADGVARGEAQEGQADQTQNGVDNDEDASHAVLVADPGGGVHDDTGKDEGRCDEALRGGGAEAHAVMEDDGQEVCDGVRDGGGAAAWSVVDGYLVRGDLQEDHCEAPNLQVEARGEEAFQTERLIVSIGSVPVDAPDNEGAFLFAEESPGFVCAVGKVDEQEKGQESNNSGDLCHQYWH